MTEIINLELSGVRSFAKNSENASYSIDFNNPVTIITGDNGTGKTTIIEALKFALTGQSSREIITDPKFWADEEIKSKIVLNINSCDGQSYSIQLNPYIKENKKQNNTSYSNGFILINSQNIFNAFQQKQYQKWIEPKLGVSLPIIENVIFCSQSDSCWPINLHGDDLKSKFDQFFNLQKYDNAIDSIHGVITDLENDNEELNKKIDKLEPEVDFYLKFKKEAKETEEKINDINDDLTKINEQINLLENSKEIISQINFLREQIDNHLPKELKILFESKKFEDKSNVFDSFHNLYEETQIRIEKLEQKCQKKQEIIKKCDDLKKIEEQLIKSTNNVQFYLNSIQSKFDDCQISEENYSQKVRSLKSSVTDKEKKLIDQKCKIRSELLVAQNESNSFTSLLSAHESESKVIEEEISKILHPENDENYLVTYEKYKKKLSEEKIELERKKSMIDTFIHFKKESENHHCCPLCKRNFKSDDEFQSFIYEILDKFISSQKETIDMCQTNEKNIDDLSKIKSKVERYEGFQREKNELLKKIESSNEKVKKLKNEIDQIDQSITDIDDNLKDINLLNKDVILLEQELKNKKSFFDQKEKIKFEIGDFDLNSLEDMKTDVFELNKQIKELKSGLITNEQLEEFIKIQNNMNDEIKKLFLYKNPLMNLKVDVSKEDFDIKTIDQISSEFELQKVKITENLKNNKESLEKAKSNEKQYSGSVLKRIKYLVKSEYQKKMISDLNRYSDSLEKLLLDYHVKKIREINDTIFYLWSRIYQGTDITSIKIEYREKLTSNKRKKYDYLVIMTKDGVDLDMFNRCSSGQKMLASIIIRIALAQTFCAKCGIIALDEPTTNLDKKNRKELANQLVEIANLKIDENENDKKKNFQLIIISHNEKFVEPIRSELGLSQYYHLKREIDKNNHHFTKIEVKKF